MLVYLIFPLGGTWRLGICSLRGATRLMTAVGKSRNRAAFVHHPSLMTVNHFGWWRPAHSLLQVLKLLMIHTTLSDKCFLWSRCSQGRGLLRGGGKSYSAYSFLLFPVFYISTDLKDLLGPHSLITRDAHYHPDHHQFKIIQTDGKLELKWNKRNQSEDTH